ncbi:sensor histidine kinase [Novosphingobium aerophilum]|uniref:sensor histidine kinase n=1 Tax=Novosphingobium TaxID=165696 RepID=UPI0012C1DDA4|nr:MULTISPECIES: ATP-binding protein [unclassified Novosphingobium]MPS70167.1 sensor histidine kinase [Novosphingobium sp.]WRT94857.1 ATP-binding protein [Novosphingobium sp. RL4]
MNLHDPDLAALRAERDALRGIVHELKTHVGLTVVSDLRLDSAATTIFFRSERARAGEQPEGLLVHPEDIRRLAALAGHSDVVTDLRVGPGGSGSLTLLLRENLGGTHWSSAVLLNMREPRHLHHAIAEKARLADLGERALTLAHELRQPLFTISMANESLRLMLDRADTTRSRLHMAAARIAAQVQRAQTIIKRTLSDTRDEDVLPGSADVMDAARHSVEFLEALFDRIGIRVELDSRGLVACVDLDRVELEQVFVNVLRNAADSIQSRREQGWDGQGTITIALEVEAGQIRCMIADNGAGLPPDLAQVAFEPFFTTKAHEGTGLGLHICRQILERAHGAIRLVSGNGEGTSAESAGAEGARVDISLPLSKGMASSDVVAA